MTAVFFLSCKVAIPHSFLCYIFQVAKENFNTILIHPDKFREILLDKIGFRSVEVVTDKLEGAVTGFDRPIEVYHKVMGTGSSS
jgi:hypothetical protein